ncbi:MAG: hypothetical protein ACE366_23725 [Bradymonadia bacterium]
MRERRGQPFITALIATLSLWGCDDDSNSDSTGGAGGEPVAGAGGAGAEAGAGGEAGRGGEPMAGGGGEAGAGGMGGEPEGGAGGEPMGGLGGMPVGGMPEGGSGGMPEGGAGGEPMGGEGGDPVGGEGGMGGEPMGGMPEGGAGGEPMGGMPMGGEGGMGGAGGGEPMEVELVDRPATFALNDEFSKLAHESDRFGEITYGYSADAFTLDAPTTLLNAEFFGEYQSGFYRELPGFSIYIFANGEGDVPDGNPANGEPLVRLERIQSGQGASGIELEDDGYNVQVDFTVANEGVPVALPPGDYWMVAAVYGPDAGAGDPTLSWFWRFSPFEAPYTPQYASNQSPAWVPVVNFRSDRAAEAMAWTMMGEVVE